VGGQYDFWEGSGDYHAPRLMRAVEGDFTVTTKIAGPGRWCGGILVWKDYRNFVRLDRGTHFRNEVMLSGTNNGPVHHAAADYIEGDPLWLRLERRGAMFTAVYSRDGKQWHPLQRLYAGTKVQPPEGEDGYSRLSEQDLAFEEGQSRLEMAAKGALQVGLFAICPQPDDGGPKRTVTDFDFFEVK